MRMDSLSMIRFGKRFKRTLVRARGWKGPKVIPAKGTGKNILKVKEKGKLGVFSGCFALAPLCGYSLWALPKV